MMIQLSFIVTVLFSALWNSRSVYSQTSLSSGLGGGRNIHILWSADVSSRYPPSDPLSVKLGDKLNITCPDNGTSNIWIQKHLEQFEECNCTVTKTINSSQCNPDDTTIRHVCQDEVFLDITFDSENLNSALSFQPNSTFYLISYSLGNKPIAGYGKYSSGGECMKGFKMAVRILPTNHTANNNNTVELPDGGETHNKNETNPNPEGLVINGAQVDLTAGVTFSFLCFLSLIATTLQVAI